MGGRRSAALARETPNTKSQYKSKSVGRLFDQGSDALIRVKDVLIRVKTTPFKGVVAAFLALTSERDGLIRVFTLGCRGAPNPSTQLGVIIGVLALRSAQGYLARQKKPTSQESHGALGIGLL